MKLSAAKAILKNVNRVKHVNIQARISMVLHKFQSYMLLFLFTFDVIQQYLFTWSC